MTLEGHKRALLFNKSQDSDSKSYHNLRIYYDTIPICCCFYSVRVSSRAVQTSDRNRFRDGGTNGVEPLMVLIEGSNEDDVPRSTDVINMS